MDTQSNNKNQEEEILEIAKDQVKPLTFDEEVKVENVFDYPILNAPTIRGGKIISGSGDKTFRFEEDKGIWLGNADFNSAPFRVDMDGNATITGATIQSASSGQRVVIDPDDNQLEFYDTDGDFSCALRGSPIGLEVIDNLGNLGSIETRSINLGAYNGAGTAISFKEDNSWDIGIDGGNHLRNIYMKGIIKNVGWIGNATDAQILFDYSGGKLILTGHVYPVMSNDQNIGSSSIKWKAVYANSHAACDLPTVDDGISTIKKIKSPVLKTGHHGKRKYFKKEYFPEEMTFINDKEERDVDLVRTTGVLLKAVQELIQKVEQLEKKLKLINK